MVIIINKEKLSWNSNAVKLISMHTLLLFCFNCVIFSRILDMILFFYIFFYYYYDVSQVWFYEPLY